MKVIGKVREYLKRTPIASVDSISRIVESKSYAYLLLNHLVKKGEVFRITKGYYSTQADPTLLVLCIKPSYLGLEDALSFHNLWEQETIPVIITPRKVRQGKRKVLKHNVLIRRILPKYFFGWDWMKYGTFLVPVSDVEKTLIDLVYFRKRIDKNLARRFKEKIDKGKLTSYLRKYPRKVRRKVTKILETRNS